MKKFLVIFFGFFLSSVSFGIPQMQFQVSPNYAQVHIYNPTGFNTFCQGFLYAQTQTGVPANIWVATWVPAYGFQTAYLYSYGPLYFINAWANINCQ